MMYALLLTVLACAVVTHQIQALPDTYIKDLAVTPSSSVVLPQQQQLALVTEDGKYCSSVSSNVNGGWAIQCISAVKPFTSSFNIMVSAADALKPIKTMTTAMQLTVRPASGFPLSVLGDGLVVSSVTPQAGKGSILQAQFALQTTPGVAGLPVAFTNAGSGRLYLTVQGPKSIIYCRVADYMTKLVGSRDPLSSLLLCDQKTAQSATGFKIQSQGWSWFNKRMTFKSVKSTKMCGSVLFSSNNIFVTCDNGTSYKPDEWNDVFYSNTLRVPQLPMRNNAEFSVQAWVEAALPSSVWITNSNGYLVSTPLSSSTPAPARNSPYLTMMKVNGPGKNSSIVSGDLVLLRSSQTSNYCSVVGAQQRVVCSTSLANVQKAADPTIYQFIYGEFVPHD